MMPEIQSVEKLTVRRNIPYQVVYKGSLKIHKSIGTIAAQTTKIFGLLNTKCPSAIKQEPTLQAYTPCNRIIFF